MSDETPGRIPSRLYMDPPVEHEHAYADPVRTNVIDCLTVEVWGDWHEIIEEWTYACPCGDKIVTRRSINGPPERPRHAT